MTVSTVVPSRPMRAGTRVSRFLRGLWYFWGKMVITWTLWLAFGVRVEGREFEPRHGGFLVAANHASALDPLLVGGALHRKVYFMARDDLFRIPVLGAWLRSMGVFPVRRGQPDRKALRTSMSLLEQGEGVVIFPEGTRSRDGRLRDPEPGAAMIALRTGALVLPAAVVGSHRILPKGARWPRFRRVTVRFGPPFAVPRIDGRLDHAVLAEWGDRIMDAIEAMLPPDQRRGR